MQGGCKRLSETAYGDEVSDGRVVVALNVASKEDPTLREADGVELEEKE